MNDLRDARVEAACKAYQAAQNADPYDFNGRMSAALAAADAVVTVEMIAVPRPRVPFGPNGVPEDEATAHYLREVVKKIDCGYATVGGSNVTATVRKLLLDAADALLRGGGER